MIRATGKLVLLAVLLTARSIFAQEIQEMYESAKQSLRSGDYRAALEKIGEAKREISLDANLDPNRVFSNRLLPKVERSANALASVMRALEALYGSEVSMAFPDLPPTRESVEQLTQLAKTTGEELLSKREQIVADAQLEPEYLDGVYKSAQFRRIEQLATVGIIDKLSQKLSTFVGALIDSLNAVSSRYDAAAVSLAKLTKAAAVDKVERETLEKELAMLSQQRLNYMMAVSEMLTGETGDENPQLRMVLMDENIDQVFANVIYSEIERIRGLGEVDSTAYKELVANFERIKKYNQIFTKNSVARDQSELLANYETAIGGVRVSEPRGSRVLAYALTALGALVLIFIVIRLASAIRRRKSEVKPKEQQEQAKRP